MKKFLYANTHGEIQQISSPTKPQFYPTPGWNAELEMYILEIDFNSNNEALLDTKYYNTATGLLADRPERPAEAFYIWENQEWVFQQDKFLAELLSTRNRDLINSDWTQVPDSPLTDTKKAEWAVYRQALRDLPSNLTGLEKNISDAPWPTPPTS